jgi:hypothetical protein
MGNTEKVKILGFKKGLNAVYNNCTAAMYTQCLADTREVIMTTEARGNSMASYYTKMNGKAPLTIAETEKLNEVFAKYGVTDWHGIE